MDYTTLVAVNRKGITEDLEFPTRNVKEKGLDKFIKEVEQVYEVKVIGTTQFIEKPLTDMME